MDIEQELHEFKETFLPEHFEWRKGQKEAIIQIVDTYLEGKYKVVVLDAPVGSGKSIIAMATSWLLNNIGNGADGYILGSDISLQEQYEKDFKEMNLNWGSIKGLANYECNDNGERVSQGTCKIRNKSPRKMPCYFDCHYYKARDKAAESQTSLLNYAYWLIMMNDVLGVIKEPIFEPRDFIIADEAHKIVDIVQNQYSPKFDKYINRKIEKLTTFFNNHHIKDHDLNLASLNVDLRQLKTEINSQKLLDLLNKIERNLHSYVSSITILKNKISKEYKHDSPPKSWKSTLRTGEWLKDFHGKLKDYCDIIEQTSINHLIKNPKGDEIVFNCLDESYLMDKYFHQWSKFTVLMSATFADPREYIKSINISNAKYIKMESNFDFTKSPIYFYNARKMSYHEIDNNLPWLNNKINQVLFKHKNERGIIHTASYNLTMKIWEGLSDENKDRVLVYSDTAEKREMLEELKRHNDKVLMGPSLLEGLDLKDNWNRFIVFAKTPYLSLGDAFVKAKMNQNVNWYRCKTIISIIQGLGRGIRHKNDWSVSYYLDASFGDLLYRNPGAFPNEIKKRIKLIKE